MKTIGFIGLGLIGGSIAKASENTMKTTDFLLMIRIGKHLLQQ